MHFPVEITLRRCSVPCEWNTKWLGVHKTVWPQEKAKKKNLSSSLWPPNSFSPSTKNRPLSERLFPTQWKTKNALLWNLIVTDVLPSFLPGSSAKPRWCISVNLEIRNSILASWEKGRDSPETFLLWISAKLFLHFRCDKRTSARNHPRGKHS